MGCPARCPQGRTPPATAPARDADRSAPHYRTPLANTARARASDSTSNFIGPLLGPAGAPRHSSTAAGAHSTTSLHCNDFAPEWRILSLPNWPGILPDLHSACHTLEASPRNDEKANTAYSPNYSPNRQFFLALGRILLHYPCVRIEPGSCRLCPKMQDSACSRSVPFNVNSTRTGN